MRKCETVCFGGTKGRTSLRPVLRGFATGIALKRRRAKGGSY